MPRPGTAGKEEAREGGAIICEFVSWIKKDKKVYFLTGTQVFDSSKGEALRRWCASPYEDDYAGHGAIRWFYGLEEREGVNRECSNFSAPKNFPAVIARAIKSGEMRGLGIPPGLHTPAAQAEYDRVCAPALAEYGVYVVTQAEYKHFKQAAFWDLFAKPENRIEAWR